MEYENRADYGQQLSKPEPGSFPDETKKANLQLSPVPNELAEQNDQLADNIRAEEEADVTNAAMAVRPFNGTFSLNGNNPLKAVENAGKNDNLIADHEINRKAEVNASVQTEANYQEEAIVARVLAGQTEAFAELIDRYKVAVYNLCARMLHDPTEAEDAAQEVFVRAFTQLHSYQSGRRFSTWILSIASHYCIDLLRRRKPVVDLDTIAFWKQSDQPEPEERALSGETRDEVRELLTKLPEKYRGVTVLRYWQDLSYEEIAEATGLSVATVKTRLFRARELLAKELEKQRRYDSNQVEEPKPRSRSLLRLKRNRELNGNAK
jgi:RNA polymerase sigma-70 factor, ECF subfamily